MIKPSENNCCGCTACQNICPENAVTMQRNNKGFLMPVISAEKCIGCGLCSKVCRFSERMDKAGADNEPLAAYALRKRRGRKDSQSGGAFAAAAEIILFRGGVVYGAAFDGIYAYYRRTDSIKELKSLKGSKYVQADLRSVFSEVKNDLEHGKITLFSGTPCHVDGLLSFLRQKKTDISLLYTCDLVCHGTPSPLLLKDYIDYLNKKFCNIQDFQFRTKKFSGWHGCNESFRIGRKCIWSNNNVNIFYSHLGLRDCCYSCPYTSVERAGDLTVGDCWGIENQMPDFDDDRGTSLLLLNTEKAESLLPGLHSACMIRKIELRDYLQPNLRHPTEKPEAYDDFWDDYFERGFLPAVSRYCGFDENNYQYFSPVRKKLGSLKRKIKVAFRR
jgi:coenzyme F420-reducing hydrogenase beta subunit